MELGEIMTNVGYIDCFLLFDKFTMLMIICSCAFVNSPLSEEFYTNTVHLRNSAHS